MLKLSRILPVLIALSFGAAAIGCDAKDDKKDDKKADKKADEKKTDEAAKTDEKAADGW